MSIIIIIIIYTIMPTTVGAWSMAVELWRQYEYYYYYYLYYNVWRILSMEIVHQLHLWLV